MPQFGCLVIAKAGKSIMVTKGCKISQQLQDCKLHKATKCICIGKFE